MKVNTPLGEVILDDSLVSELSPDPRLRLGQVTAHSEVERIIRCAMQAETSLVGNRVARRIAITTLAAQNIAMMSKDYDLTPWSKDTGKKSGSFGDLRYRTAGAISAESGFDPETNPHPHGTDEHRFWIEGYYSTNKSKTPLDHTYEIGDVVRWRSANEREQDIGAGGPNHYRIEDISGDTDPCQLLRFEGKHDFTASVLVELVPEN